MASMLLLSNDCEAQIENLLSAAKRDILIDLLSVGRASKSFHLFRKLKENDWIRRFNINKLGICITFNQKVGAKLSPELEGGN